jgi:hypothetical protein
MEKARCQHAGAVVLFAQDCRPQRGASHRHGRPLEPRLRRRTTARRLWPKTTRRDGRAVGGCCVGRIRAVSHIGPLAVRISDRASGVARYAWSWAATGRYRTSQHQRHAIPRWARLTRICGHRKGGLHCNSRHLHGPQPGLPWRWEHSRTDIREWKHNLSYRWRPKRASGDLARSDGTGELEPAGRFRFGREPNFALELRRATLEVSRTESFELFQRTGFRKNGTLL